MSLRFYHPSITNPSSTQKPEEQDTMKLLMETCGYTCAYYGGLVALKCSKTFLFFFKPVYFITAGPFHVISRIFYAVSKILGHASIHPVFRVAYRSDGTAAIKRCTYSLPSSDTTTGPFPGQLRIAEDNAFRCLGYFFETVFATPLFHAETEPGVLNSGSYFTRPEVCDEPCRAVVRYRSNVLLHLVRFLDFLTVANACRILRACDPSDHVVQKPIPMYRRVSIRFSNPSPWSSPREPSCKEMVLYRGGRYEHLFRWIACATRAKPMDSAAEGRCTTIDEQRVWNNVGFDDSEPGSKSEWEEVFLDPHTDPVMIREKSKVTPHLATVKNLESARRPDAFPIEPGSSDVESSGFETNAGKPAETKIPVLDGSATTKSSDPQHLPHSSVLLGMSSSLSTIAELTKDETGIRMKRKEVRVSRVSVTEMTPAVNLRRISEEKAVEGETVAEYRADRDSGIQTCEMGHKDHKICGGEKRHGLACRMKQALRKMKEKIVDAEGARDGL